MDEYEPPRRPWVLIVASLLLAALTAWMGVQWKQGEDREAKLRAELKQVYLEAEQMRVMAQQAQQRVSLLEKQVMALTAERESTTRRLEDLEAELAKVRPGFKRATPPPAAPRR